MLPKCVPSDTWCCVLDPEAMDTLAGLEVLVREGFGTLIPGNGWLEYMLETIGGFPGKAVAPGML